MPQKMSKAGVAFFLSFLFLTVFFQWGSVHAAYATLFAVTVYVPPSGEVGQGIIVQASIVATGCSACTVSGVQAVLTLPSKTNLLYGDNPAHVGDMKGGDLRNVSWTVVFQEVGSYFLYVNASGLDSNMVFCSVLGSATVDVSEEAFLLGDINRDMVVDIFDVVTVSVAFGSTPLDPNWNEAADVNNDDVVDIFDTVLLANNFGKTA